MSKLNCSKCGKEIDPKENWRINENQGLHHIICPSELQQEYDDWIKATGPNHDQHTSFMAGYKRGKSAQQTTPPETQSVKAIGSSDFLNRARQPREGDKFRKSNSVCVVKAIGDGKVWYDLLDGRSEPTHHEATLEEWFSLAGKTVLNGATFEEA